MDNASFRYRVHFAKLQAMQFTSHLDLHRALERTFRRANLPLAYSQGYNPRPKINLGSALPLGMMAECELVDVWLSEVISTDDFMASITHAAPPGIAFHHIEQIDLRAPTLQSQIVSAIYRVGLEEGAARRDLQTEINNLMAAASLPRTRRGKSYDLRPLLERLELMSDSEEPLTLTMTLSAREGATGRADEVLQALGCDPSRTSVVRTDLVLMENKST